MSKAEKQPPEMEKVELSPHGFISLGRAGNDRYISRAFVHRISSERSAVAFELKEARGKRGSVAWVELGSEDWAAIVDALGRVGEIRWHTPKD